MNCRSPEFGLPGQSITVSMIDNNPFPDYDTHWGYVSPNNTLTNILNNNINYNTTVTGFHEGNGVYTGDTDGSYYIYGPFKTAASINNSASKLLASATYDELSIKKNIPIGHLLQDSAISFFEEEKITYYKIGSYEHKRKKETTRQKNVIFFKKGFANSYSTQFILSN